MLRLPDDAVRVIASHARTRTLVTLRAVCTETRRAAEAALRARYEDELCELLRHMSISVHGPLPGALPFRWLLKYIRSNNLARRAPRGPRFPWLRVAAGPPPRAARAARVQGRAAMYRARC